MFGMNRAKVFATMLMTMDLKKKQKYVLNTSLKILNESKIPLLYK